MSFDYIFKYIVIGDSSVGKSCIVLRFIEGEFNDEMENTIGVEFGAKVIPLGNQNIKLQIWDTAGQEAFQSITRSYYRSAAAALLVYDITKLVSFENCESWLEKTKTNGSSEVVVCLVGNKCDMEDKREVSREQAEMFAEKNGLLFFETSALKDLNVERVFKAIGQRIIKKVQTGRIDPAIEEFGVKKIGGDLADTDDFDDLMEKSKKKRQGRSTGCC